MESGPGQSLEKALNGRLGVSAVGELARNPMPYGLADLLGQCLPGRKHGFRLELLRTKFRPGRKLTAYYGLSIGPEVRPIALSWFAEPPPEGPNAAHLRDEAAERQLLAPFADLSARTADGRAFVQIAPVDPQMPQLVRLYDQAYVVSTLEDLSGGSISWSTASIRPVRYRPGQRHVLAVSSASDRHRTGAFIKLDHDDRGARAVAFAQAVGPRLAERCRSTRLVSPVCYSPSDRASVWRRVAGRLLSQEVHDPARAVPLLAVLARGVRVLHDLDVQIGTSTTEPDQRSVPQLVSTELDATLHAGEYLRVLLPEVGAQYRQLALEVQDRLGRVPEETPRLGHGDLKCDNIVARRDRVGLLDLDRTGWADPALDIGKMVADLRWWGDHHSVGVAALVGAFLRGYGRCDPARIARARLIAVLYQLKLAAHRTQVHSPDWEAQMTRHVNEAAAALRQETAA